VPWIGFVIGISLPVAALERFRRRGGSALALFTCADEER
jgi:hypothetical protein